MTQVARQESTVSTYTRLNRTDPTRTTFLRQAFIRDLNKRFKALRGAIRRAIILQDCFGLQDKEFKMTLLGAPDISTPGRKAFAFSRSEEKVAAFMDWLKRQEEAGILEIGAMKQLGTPIETAWTNKYILDSYKRGVQRARRELIIAGYAVPPLTETGGIQASMSTPFHAERCFTSPHVKIYTNEGWKGIGKIKVGDLVLTHKGRFRKVTKIHQTPKQMPRTVRIEAGKGQRCIIATVGHPVRVGDKWILIENVKVGDKIKYLAARCKNCGKLIPYENQYCNIDCAREGTQESRSNKVKALWEDKSYREKTIREMKASFDNGKRNRFEATKKANDATRDRVRKGIPVGFQAFSQEKKDAIQRKAYDSKKEAILNGVYGFQSKELREKALRIQKPIVKKMIKEGRHPFVDPSVRAKALQNASIATKKLAEKGLCGLQVPERMEKAIKGIAKYRRELGKKFARKGAGQTGIERKMQAILDDIGVSYIPEYNIGRYIVDFAIPSLSLAIEVDGKYWHQDTEKDRIRQLKIEEKGWDVLRFGEDEINNYIADVRDTVCRVICNHTGMYEFVDLQVTRVKYSKVKTPKMLYNLSVEEDESYIAGGFVVHNCGVLYSRVFEELKGITSQMDTQISRVLTQGLADGENPRKLAKLLTKTISGPVGDLGITDTLGRFIPAERRAQTLARTEIIRSFHQANVQEMKNWAVEGVVVQVEFTTAGYRVCPICSALEGKVFSLDEIQNKIPLHPNCFLDPQTPVYTSTGWKSIGSIQVGDYVLTHKGRFRKVYALPRNKGYKDETEVVRFSVLGMGQGGLSMTANHPVLITKEGCSFSRWKEAGKVKKTDQIQLLASRCKRCETLIPYFKQYCNKTCYNTYLRKSENNVMYGKHHSRETKEMIGYIHRNSGKFKGENNPMYGKKRPDLSFLNKSRIGIPISEEAKEKQRKAVLLYWQSEEGIKNKQRLSVISKEWAKRHPEAKLSAAKKGHASCPKISSLELKLQNSLHNLGIPFISQYEYELGFADIFIPPNIYIFADGEYWHSSEIAKEKDRKQTEFLQDKGNIVLRYTGAKINQCLGEIEEELSRVVMNHSGQYEFVSFPIQKIEHWKLRKNRRLYNLSVEEDESYLAKGLIVHNCRCCAIPVKKEKATKKAVKKAMPKKFQFVPVNDLEGAKKAAKAVGIQDVVYGKIDSNIKRVKAGREYGTVLSKKEAISLANKILPEIYELKNRFPNIPLQGIQELWLSEGRGMATLGSTKGRFMLIGTQKEWNRAAVLRVLAWEKKNRRRWAVMSIDKYKNLMASALRHELGHALTTEKIWAHFLKVIGKEKLSINWFRENVSEYAATKMEESLAETFALYTSKNYKTGMLPKSLEKIMKEMVEGDVGEFGTK